MHKTKIRREICGFLSLFSVFKLFKRCCNYVWRIVRIINIHSCALDWTNAVACAVDYVRHEGIIGTFNAVFTKHVESGATDDMGVNFVNSKQYVEKRRALADNLVCGKMAFEIYRVIIKPKQK